MEYMSEGFVFYRSFYDAITGSGMNEKDQLTAFKAICAYALYGDAPEQLEGLPYGLFTIAKASIDSNTRKRESGKKGGRPRKETTGFENKNHRFPKNKSTETDTDTGTDTETDNRADNQGLMLYGEPGGGKSFYAACVVNDLRRQGVPAQMCSAARLLMSLDAWDDRESIMGAVRSVPLLVLDDIGAERDTEYQTEKLFAVIDARVQSGRPLIVTTNLTPMQLKNPDTLLFFH